MSHQFWYVNSCSLFERLSQQQLSRLERHARMRTFPKGSAIYLPTDQSQGAFLLGAGRVRICSTTPEGKQAILAFVKAGELFGEMALVQDGLREERAEAAEVCQVILLPADELRRLMAECSQLSLGIIKLIGLRRRRIERRLKSLLFRSTRERLGCLLIDLIDQFGKKCTDGTLVDVRLSHQELASIIGATRESVTIHLGELQSEGMIRQSRMRIIVTDLRSLTCEFGVSHQPNPAELISRDTGMLPAIHPK